MIVLNSYDHIEIGLYIRLLLHISSSSTAEYTVRMQDKLSEMLESANFAVSLEYFRSLNFSSMRSKVKEITPKEDSIGDEVAKYVTEQMVILESVIFSEASTKNIYLLPERRFNSEFLMNNPSRLLKKELLKNWMRLPNWIFHQAADVFCSERLQLPHFIFSVQPNLYWSATTNIIVARTA